MTSTAPPPGQRNPPIHVEPVPSEAPGTRRSAIDLPAWPGHVESLPPSRDDGRRRSNPPAHDGQGAPSESASPGSLRGPASRGPAVSPRLLGIAAIVTALGGGAGLQALLRPAPAPQVQTVPPEVASVLSELAEGQRRQRADLRAQRALVCLALEGAGYRTVGCPVQGAVAVGPAPLAPPAPTLRPGTQVLVPELGPEIELPEP